MLPRRAEFALRAFPKRFRTARAEEMRGVFADAADAGDTAVLGPRALVDLVVSGWRERLRTRPPLRVFLAYRLLEHRLPEPYHRWMFDDVTGAWFGLRRYLWTMTPLGAVVPVLVHLGLPMQLPMLVGWAIVVSSVAVMSPLVDIGGHRRAVLERHGYDSEMRWLPPVRSARLGAGTARVHRRSRRVER